MYSLLSPSMVSSIPLLISPDSVENIYYKGTSVELRHVRSTIPGLILNPTYLIDGNRVQATPSRDLDPSANGRQEPWAYNQTLVNVTGLVNAEHKLEVHLSQPDQLFVRFVLPSFRKELTQSPMNSSTT